MRLTAFVLVLIALCSRPALADDKEKDRELAAQHYEAGKAAFDEGRLSTAFLEFGLSYELSKEPLLLADLALVAEKLGRTEDALRYSRLFLERAPTDTPQDAIDQARERIDRLSHAPAPSGRSEVAAATKATPSPAQTTLRSPARAKKIVAAALVVVGGIGLLAALGTGIEGAGVARQVEAGPLSLADYQSLDGRGRALNAGFGVSLALGLCATTAGSVWLGFLYRH